MLDDLLNNPAIASLGEKPYWTVSQTKGKKGKRPLNFSKIINQGKIEGVYPGDAQATTTLETLLTYRFANNDRFSNATFNLDAIRDKYFILDIEKTCPEDVKARLLTIPCAYAETSASGLGIHMLIPLAQEIIDTFPILEQKTVVKAADNTYEFLFSHWVMFTGNVINYVSGTPSHDDLTPLFELCANLRETSISGNVDVDGEYELDLSEDWMASRLADVNSTMTSWLGKHSVEAYGNDWSRYTFAFLVRAVNAVELSDAQLAQLIREEHTPASDAEIARIVYRVAKDVFPHRDKHDEERLGMPFLMYRALYAVQYARGENPERG